MLNAQIQISQHNKNKKMELFMQWHQRLLFINGIGTGIKVAALSAAFVLMTSTSHASDWPDGLKADMQKAGIAVADKWIDRRDPQGEAWDRAGP